MALILKIAGVDRTNLLRQGTLRISDALNQRSTASFILVDPSGVYDPEVGESVEVYDEGGDLIFGGSIDEYQEEQPQGGVVDYHTVQCVDHHLLADRRIVAEAYDNLTAGAIVQDLITKYLAAEGVTAGTIQAGPTITRAVFNYVPASEALDQISELSGCQWCIRANKALDFFDRATFSAPWAVTSTRAIMRPRVTRDRRDYRNRQYVRAGKDRTDPRTESFKGDGVTKTFTLAFPVAEVPSVAVNGVTKTVGIRGVETGKDWYWSKDDPTITQDDAAVALTATDTLSVTYRGFFPVVVQVDEGGQQTARKNLEGGSGVYERVDDAPNLDSQQAALELAQGKLRRYARIGATLTYETFLADLRSGHLQSVDLPGIHVSGVFLISEVETVDASRGDGQLLRRVTALDGEAVGGWAAFFRRMAQQGRQFVIRENEVLVKLTTLSDGVILADTLTRTAAAPESRVGYALAGYSEVA